MAERESQPDGPIADSNDGYKLRGDEFDPEEKLIDSIFGAINEELDLLFAPLEEEEEPEICGGCNGSGEGQYEGLKCSTCGGSGQKETEAQRAAREDEDDHAESIREDREKDGWYGSDRDV